jgi:mannosyltransferase
MKVIIDNIIWTSKGGVYKYFQELIKYLHKKKVNYSVINYEEDTHNNRKDIFYKKKRFLERFRLCNIESGKFNIFHSSYYRLPSCKQTKIVTTVHDFTHQREFSWFSSMINLQVKIRSFKKSNALICISKNTKKDLLTYYQPKEWQQVHVIYNGISNDYYKIKNNYDYKKYFLYVGHRTQGKNWEHALDILKKNKDFQLVVVGGNPNKKSFFKKIDKSLTDRIQFKGYISNYELNELYNNAFCLFYPSSYEGFGIPVIEAFASGCPVIANSKCEVIKEIAENEVILFDPTIQDDHIIKFNLLKELNRVKIIEDGIKKSKEFSWEKSMSKIVDVYESLSEK